MVLSMSSLRPRRRSQTSRFPAHCVQRTCQYHIDVLAQVLILLLLWLIG